MLNKAFLSTALVGLLLNAHLAFAHSNKNDHVKTVSPDEMKYESSPALPEEIKLAILLGDFQTDGHIVFRLKAPAGSKIAPHWHPIDEHVTVLSGSMHVGSGDTLDKEKSTKLPTGGFISIPAKHHHFAWFDEDSVIQINDFGLWAINYINPKDDPRNK